MGIDYSNVQDELPITHCETCGRFSQTYRDRRTGEQYRICKYHGRASILMPSNPVGL